jgi:hypothetical protein
MGYGLDGPVSIPGRAKFSLLHGVQTDSGANPITSYPMGIGGDFPRGYSGQDPKLTTHFHLVPRSRMVELYLHSPICLHGIVLK